MPRPSILLTSVVVLTVLVLLLALRIASPQLGIWGPATSLSAAEIHYKNMVLYHTRGDAALPSGRVIFLGDSLVQGLPVNSVTDLGINYGIGSDTTDGLLRRIDQYPSIDSAAAVVVAMGSNDLFKTDHASFLANYVSILDMIPAEVPVVCSAILPVDEKVDDDWSKRSNARIIEWNLDIENMCEERGLVYIDAAEDLVDGQGDLATDFHVGDGLHLNPEGNQRWVTHLQAALSQLGVAE